MTWTRAWALVWFALLFAGAADAAGVAGAQTDLRFKADPQRAAAALGDMVLSSQERAFIAQLPELRVAVPSPPFRPYEVIDASGEVSGLHPEMLVALGQALGLRFKPVPMPNWPAAQEAAKRKQVDVLMTVGVTPERLEFLEFTLGATPAPAALFTREGAALPEKGLERGRFVLEREFVSNDYVQRQYPQASILTVETTADALRALGAGKADFYLGSLLATADVISRENLQGLAVNRLLSQGTGYFHFAVRKDWAPLAAVLNKGIQNLRAVPDTGLVTAQTLAPPGLVLRRPLPLTAEQRESLSRQSVWRIGAVRGLFMLNDFDAQVGHTGIGADYLLQVAQRLGVGVQIEAFENVAAMLQAVREGRIDVVPLLSKTPQRAAEFGFSQPYIDIPYVLVARSDAPMYWGLDSLRGRKLALARDHPLRDVLAKSFPTVTVVDAADGSLAMDMVRDGLADAAVEIKLFANLRINGEADNGLRVTANVEELPAQFHMATSKAAQFMVPLLDAALADIGPEERTRLLRRWVASDLKPAFPWRRYLPVMVAAGLGLLTLVLASLWWARRLSREVTARRSSEAMLNDIAASVPGVVFRYVLKPDGGVISRYTSPGSAAFLGLPALDDSKTLVSEMAPYLGAEDRKASEKAEIESAVHGKPVKMTVAYDHPTRGLRWLHAESALSARTATHQVWTGYIVDVSTERELQSRLSREAESRNLLLASASHELRAPTHALSLALQSVTGRGLPAAEAGALLVAQQSAQTLAQLLNDVLDAARYSADSVKVRPRSFDLHALIHEVAGAWRAAAASKNLAFELKLHDDVPRRVVLDPLRVKQVLTNLLSNACKYTAVGRVWLTVGLGESGELHCVVGDTGVGIAAHAQAALFEPYATVQGPARTALPEGSTGLGLSICRRLAGLMGGQIELRSVLGEGTVVHFSVPLPEVARVVAPGMLTGKILVCDDDPVSRLMMTHMLRRAGFDALETTDGNDALQRWREGGVAAIITDLDMPGLTGVQLMSSVREAEASGHTNSGQRTVLVVCSGSEVPDAAQDVREGHLHDAYLVKPVQMDILTQTLRDVGLVEH
jgi:two-component system, NarL family, sensor histidine kinase EvgS